MGNWTYCLIFFGAIGIIYSLCLWIVRGARKIRRAIAQKLANDLQMEVLASDNPDTLIVAGEVNDRPITIRYQNEKTSLDHLRTGADEAIKEKEQLLISVECNCAIDFSVLRVDSSANPSDHADLVDVPILALNGLQLKSQQKENAALIFEEPETVKTLLELFEETGIRNLAMRENRVTSLILEQNTKQPTSAKISFILQELDQFARLLEFIASDMRGEN